MPGRRARGPELPRTISLNGGLHKAPHRLTKAEVALLERFLECARIGKVVRKRDARWCAVPPKLWEPLAQTIAQDHGITVRQMLYEGKGYRFVIPRARFWRTLRAFTRDGTEPRYSLKAIAEITGHHHTSVLHALQVGTAELDYSKVMVRVQRYERAQATQRQRAERPETLPPNKRRDHTGEEYGALKVLAAAPAPEGAAGRWWRCLCSCGSITVQSTRALVQGKQACGVNGHRHKSLVRVSHNLMDKARERAQLP